MLITTALVAGPWRDQAQESPTTASISDSSHLPGLFQVDKLQIVSGLAVGVVSAIGLWWWLRRTVGGFELKAVGSNPIAATFAGINQQKVIVKAMVGSGALSGLAGAVQVLAVEHRFYPSMASGYGFDGLGVALLAGNTPLGMLPSAVLFGALNKGGTAIQVIDQVPKGITTVILGLLIMIAAAIRYRKKAANVGS
jgi:simple sugar transport system permease protein